MLLLLQSLRRQDRNSGRRKSDDTGRMMSNGRPNGYAGHRHRRPSCRRVRSASRGALELVLRCKMQHHGRLLLLVKNSGVVGQHGVVDWRRVRQILGRLFATDVFQALKEEASFVGRNASASASRRTMQLTAAEFGRQQRQIIFRSQRSNTWITVNGGFQQRGYTCPLAGRCNRLTRGCTIGERGRRQIQRVAYIRGQIVRRHAGWRKNDSFRGRRLRAIEHLQLLLLQQVSLQPENVHTAKHLPRSKKNDPKIDLRPRCLTLANSQQDGT